jgi:DNA end-binding protein Ku
MAPRPSWKGYLALSLVSCPVALYPAASTSERVSLHMLNAETGNRLKQQYVDSETGDVVERDDRVKGYEVTKGDYVILTDDELADVKIESSHTIEIERFVPKTEIDPLYFDNNYFLTPDDKVGEEAFAVIREAMRRRAMVGIARVVLFGRERMLMLEPRDKGMVGTTLRYAYEVRGAGAYFDEIPKVELSKELLDLASHIIDTKTGAFEPETFKDRYQDAVVELIKAKQAGRPAPANAPADRPSNVVNLMDALRRSLGQSGDSASTEGASAGRATRKSPAKTAPAKRAAEKSATKTSAKAKAEAKPKTPAARPAKRGPTRKAG